MDANDNTESRKPLFVRAFLWGARSRPQALAYMWSNIIVAVIGLMVGLIFSAIFLFFALADWGAVRWIDKHEGWADNGVA